MLVFPISFFPICLVTALLSFHKPVSWLFSLELPLPSYHNTFNWLYFFFTQCFICSILPYGLGLGFFFIFLLFLFSYFPSDFLLFRLWPLLVFNLSVPAEDLSFLRPLPFSETVFAPVFHVSKLCNFGHILVASIQLLQMHRAVFSSESQYKVSWQVTSDFIRVRQ